MFEAKDHERDDRPVFVDLTGRRGRAMRGAAALWPPTLSLGLAALTVALLQVVGLLQLPFVTRSAQGDETLVSADGNAGAIAELNARTESERISSTTIGEPEEPVVEVLDEVRFTAPATTAAPAAAASSATGSSSSSGQPSTATVAELPTTVPSGVVSPTTTAVTATEPWTTITFTSPSITTSIAPPPTTTPPTTTPPTTTPPTTTPPTTTPPTTTPPTTTPPTTTPPTTTTIAPTTIAGPSTAEIAQGAAALRAAVRRGDPAASAGVSPAVAAAACDPANGRRGQPELDTACAELGF